ncbi:MAG: MoxR family ATPase [Chitinispirillia bacterium]|jgi:MoxR-like ATPase
MDSENNQQIQSQIIEFSTKTEEITTNIKKVFLGNGHVVDKLLIGFMSGLHVLIEDIPGVGKTTLAKCLARVTGLDFGRIQFTPDLLPGDILGFSVWSREKEEFIFKPGAIMHQFVLADEINRASARTQSSLLESMQEKHITVDNKTYDLPDPFFIIATQNPISFEGTFKLPEAELDRFGISFSIGYPDREAEKEILNLDFDTDISKKLRNFLNKDDIKKMRLLIKEIHTDEKIVKFLLEFVNLTREHRYIKLGLSPRGSQHLLRAARAKAFLEKRDFVVPEDLKEIIPLVVSHKIIPSADARMEKIKTRDIIDSLLSRLPLPTGL